MSIYEKAAELEALANSAEINEAHQALAVAREKLTFVNQHARAIIGELPSAGQIGEIVEKVNQGIEQQGTGIEEVKQALIDTAGRVRSAGSS